MWLAGYSAVMVELSPAPPLCIDQCRAIVVCFLVLNLSFTMKFKIYMNTTKSLILQGKLDSKAVMHRIANPLRAVRLRLAPPTKKAVTVCSNGFFISDD